MTLRPIVLLLGLSLACAACKGDQPGEASADDAARRAKGEVVGGTISDDMLPLDSLRSQSPPLKEEPRSATGSTPAPGTQDAGSTEPASPTPEPATETETEGESEG